MRILKTRVMKTLNIIYDFKSELNHRRFRPYFDSVKLAKV